LAIHQLKKSISRGPATDYLVKLNPNMSDTVFTSPIVEMLTFHGLPAEFTENSLVWLLVMVVST
jgi:hypothetical protein